MSGVKTWARAAVADADALGRTHARIMARVNATGHEAADAAILKLHDLYRISDTVDLRTGGDGHLEPHYHMLTVTRDGHDLVVFDESAAAAVDIAWKHWCAR